VQGWINHVRYADTWGLRRHVLEPFLLKPGDSLAVNGKYYASIGDHLAPRGNAFVYEYDPEKKQFRLLADVRKILGGNTLRVMEAAERVSAAK
jgi:hypothetical protein